MFIFSFSKGLISLLHLIQYNTIQCRYRLWGDGNGIAAFDLDRMDEKDWLWIHENHCASFKRQCVKCTSEKTKLNKYHEKRGHFLFIMVILIKHCRATLSILSSKTLSEFLLKSPQVLLLYFLHLEWAEIVWTTLNTCPLIYSLHVYHKMVLWVSRKVYNNLKKDHGFTGLSTGVVGFPALQRLYFVFIWAFKVSFWVLGIKPL